MDANTVTAICATVIAVLSLAISFSQTRAARQHNRHAVRPFLELWVQRESGARTGILLVNHGLGPAIITRSVFRLDGRPIGEWDEESVNPIRKSFPKTPAARTFSGGNAIPAGSEAFLLSLDDFDREEHAWFYELIRERMQLEIHYESLYGGEDFTVTLNKDQVKRP